MRNAIRFLTVFAALALAPGRPARAQAPSFRVVVHGSVPAASLDRGKLADYLLKRATRWPDGTAVTVVDLSATSPVRGSLSRAVLGKSVDAVLHYWQQQMFSGRGTPPAVRTEAEAVALVAATPGALGYVGADTPVPAGARVVHLAN